jgi:hypothetical protein
LERAERTTALVCYAAAALVAIGGVAAAVARFPGGFDWVYMVISKLGSSTHNPSGAPWLAGALLVAVYLLWPVTGVLARGATRPRLPVAALRAGLAGAGLLAVEGLFALDLSRLARKGHEAVALLTFLGLYGGVLGLYAGRIRRSASFLWPALLVFVPLCAVGVSQVALYFDQRDLGWVNTTWRDLGVPFWLSFAFWQWLAVAFLGIGIGGLLAIREPGAWVPLQADAGADQHRRPVGDEG